MGTCGGFRRVYTSVRTSLIEENHLSGRDQTPQEHAETVRSILQIFWICKRTFQAHLLHDMECPGTHWRQVSVLSFLKRNKETGKFKEWAVGGKCVSVLRVTLKT